MKRTLLIGLLTISSLLGVTGCSDDDNNNSGSQTHNTPTTSTTDFKLTCKAELAQGRHFDYVVNGSTLTLEYLGQSAELAPGSFG